MLTATTVTTRPPHRTLFTSSSTSSATPALLSPSPRLRVSLVGTAAATGVALKGRGIGEKDAWDEERPLDEDSQGIVARAYIQDLVVCFEHRQLDVVGDKLEWELGLPPLDL